MQTILFVLEVVACFCVGMDAHKRGRSFWRWTVATMLVTIMITWPLLSLLPRYDVAKDVL